MTEETALALVDQVPALRAVSVKRVVPPDEWQSESRRVIQAAMDEFPEWNTPIRGEVNYRFMEFNQALRSNFPIHSDEDPIPDEFTGTAEEWQQYQAGFMEVWYRECAALMGHNLRVPGPKPKQRSLF